ncbi:salivary glue protein Sgs-3-like isoform X4 [Eriocheir sinensis]|uniref:salivary glue protein Sgs-3-like isoform X4 n=1 Tax=Eriocheir sinensis TaxID=95602 RepID=UPI0021C8537E|nr:salivary glue protein Sgs-3-like isoform X4 [Eriocheir sinensis]
MSPSLKPRLSQSLNWMVSLSLKLSLSLNLCLNLRLSLSLSPKQRSSMMAPQLSRSPSRSTNHSESEDYYSYEYDDLYDDPAEQSKDQKFGGSSAQVVFAVPVTKYVPELVLTTTPAAERVEAFSEATNSEMTIFEGSQVTAEGSQWATETPQVTSSPEDTSHMLRETTVTQVTEEVPQTTDVPEVTDEMVEVTEEVMVVTEVVPQMTTEDAVAETITESPVTSETTLMPDDTTTEREGAVHQSHADGTSSTPKPAAPVITFLPFPFTTTTTPTTTSTTTSRPRPVSIRPLHARLLNAGKKKVSPSVASAKKDSGALKIVAKSTVAEIQSSDPVICFPGHPCVRAVGVGRLLPP